MLGFGKKKDTTDENIKDKKSKKPEKKKKGDRKKKKNEHLESVFRESVVASSMVDLRNNEKFIHDGKYVAIMVNANDLISNGVGGISKKTRNDEAKGSFIEAVNSSKIKTIITPELLENEDIIIIPDDATINIMEEYSMLIDAPYKIVLIGDDESITTQNATTLKSVINVSKGIITLEEFLGLEDEDEYEDDDEEEIEELEAVEDDNLEPIDEDVMIYDEPVENVAEDIDGEIYEYEETDEDDDIDENVSYTSVEDEYEEEYEDDTEVGLEEFTNNVRSRVISEDLDLEVSLDPFDIHFSSDNAFAFDEDRGEGFLNEQLSNLAREANAEISSFRRINVEKLREKYLNLINIHAKQIGKDLDIHDESNSFGEQYKGIQKIDYDYKSKIDEYVNNNIAKAERDFNERAEQYAEAFRQKAIQDYKANHFAEFQHSKDNARLTLIRDHDNTISKSMKSLFSDRKQLAQIKMEQGVNTILNYLMDDYNTILDRELELYNEWKELMSQHLNDNRLHEIARVEVLNKELETGSRIQKIISENDEMINAMRKTFDDERSRLELEIETIERRAQESVRIAKEDCDRKISYAEERENKVNKSYADLLEKFKSVDEDKGREFNAVIKELQSERDAWKLQAESVSRNSNKVNIAIGVIAVVATVAACCVGYALGINKKVETKQSHNSTPIIQYQTPYIIPSEDIKDKDKSNQTEQKSSMLEQNADQNKKSPTASTSK